MKIQNVSNQCLFAPAGPYCFRQKFGISSKNTNFATPQTTARIAFGNQSYYNNTKMKKLLLTILSTAAISIAATASTGSLMERLQAPSPFSGLEAETMTQALPASVAGNHAPFKAVRSASSVPTFFGWVAYDSEWNKNVSGNYGIYAFPAVANTRFDKIWTTKNASAAANADGKLCGYYVLNYGGAIAIRYYMYDGDSGELMFEKNYNSQNVTDVFTHYAYTLAYNYKNATLYGEFFRSVGNDVVICLSTIDPLTGVPTEITELKTGTVIFLAMAFDGNGNLYAIGDDGNLYAVDPATGKADLIGATGLSPTDPQAAYIDTATGKMYWAYLSKDLSTGFYEVNLSTGRASLVSEYPGTTWMVGLYGTHTATGKVPGKVTDLAVTYATTTSLDANISFTAPVNAADGSALSGNLDLEVYVDYEKLTSAPATIAPGATFSTDRTFTAGRHKVEVILKNNAGYSERTSMLTFAGKDVPGAPTKLIFKLDGRTANLTWTAPETGAKGGWFDASALTYQIVRQPDNTIVAPAWTSTTFTDELPDQLGNYFYEVTSMTTEAGAKATSNRILYGTAMTVPYKETFDTDAPLDLFTIEDANEDGYYWKWSNGNMMNVRGDAPDAADWLITPPIALTTEYIYKLKFDAHGFGTYYTEHFNAGVASQPKGSDMKIVGNWTVNGDKFQSYEALVEVNADGNYHIGIQHATPAPNTSRDELHIDNIELVPFISTAGPASVGKLAIELLPDNATKGTMTFTLPTKAMNGSTLTSLEKVEIYRDGVLVETKTGIAPGDHCSLEIDVPQGAHLFNVIAYNEIGRGHDTEIEVFGGVDIPRPVANLRYQWDAENDNKAILMWDAPGNIGIHGMEIPSVTYNILSPMWGMMIDQKTGLTECSYEVTANMLSQDLVQRGVQAVSAGGKSTMEVAYINLGAPISLTTEESFENGTVKYPTWTVSAVSGQARWSMYNSNPEIADAQDGDNGYAMCIAGEDGGEDRLVSPAFNFSSTETAYLHLWLFHSSTVDPATTLTIETTTNGHEFTAVSEPIRVNNGKEGWQEHQVSLASLAGTRKAIIGFRANVPDQQSRVIMDNLSIDYTSGIGTVENDLNGGISVTSAPGAILINGAAGSTFTVCTPDGKSAASGTAASGTCTIPVASGIYIVEVAGTTAKVAVQ